MSRSQELAGRRVGGRRPQVGGGGPWELVELGKRFARFRQEHPQGTRIPDDLRAAALGLLREVAPAEVYRTCGITFGQVMAWKEAEARRPTAPDVRVFSVVDEAAPRLAPQATTAAVAAAAPALELRLGPWSVSVQLAGPAGRG